MTDKPLLSKPDQQGMFDYKTLEKVEKCGSDDLYASWLANLGLKRPEDARAAFLAHDIAGPDVVYLDHSDLKELLPKTIGDQKKILRSMYVLKNAKVSENKNRVIAKYFTWERFFCCLWGQNQIMPVLVTPTALKFKDRQSSMTKFSSKQRVSMAIGMDQIEDLTVMRDGRSSCDNDMCRTFCGCPLATLMITTSPEQDGDMSHGGEYSFLVRDSEAKDLEQCIRDAMTASKTGQSSVLGEAILSKPH